MFRSPNARGTFQIRHPGEIVSGSLRDRARDWSRRRFILASVLVGMLCVLLIVLDGVSAAFHFHAGVAIFGVLFFVVLLVWFRVIESRSANSKRN